MQGAVASTNAAKARDLVEQARAKQNTNDYAGALDLYGQAEQLILRDAAAIPIHHETTHALVRPYVKGLTYTPLGILVALVFVGLPFVVRTVEPVLRELDGELEAAAALLGARRWQILVRVVLPPLLPALLTGATLAFARAIGEYGSVIFISSNMPGVSEIVPLLIVVKLEQFDYAGAATVATLMLIASFMLLLAINLIQAWTRRRHGG